MASRDTFSSYNPIINFTFFIGAVVFGMFFIHPVFLLCSLVLAFSYYVTVHGIKAFRLLLAMVPVFIVVTAINPLFSPYGDHVLFIYLGERPYTLEALYYGGAIALMFVCVIVWFASYNSVMTSDKFIYIFGRAMPSISLVLSMILRLIPNFQRKAEQIAQCRKCVGKAVSNSSKKEKVGNGMIVLSSLTTWALEGGILTADSMRSRGYGSGKRSNFAIYRWDVRDVSLMVIMLLLAVVILVSSFNEGTRVTYTPSLDMAGPDNPYTIIGLGAYIAFLAIPTVLNIMEAITWRILRSKI